MWAALPATSVLAAFSVAQPMGWPESSLPQAFMQHQALEVEACRMQASRTVAPRPNAQGPRARRTKAAAPPAMPLCSSVGLVQPACAVPPEDAGRPLHTALRAQRQQAQVLGGDPTTTARLRSLTAGLRFLAPSVSSGRRTGRGCSATSS